MKSIRILRLLCLLVPCVFTLRSMGATLCVTSSGAPGCYTSISAAVAAASPYDVINVGPGTYQDSVTISMPLSLVGSGATIDATGLSRGIFVNGMAAPKLASVHISGLTVQNANLEGILVANASDVTVSGNSVLNNNKALADGNCTQLPAIEPGEAQDCGEGIHLMAADHSIVTNNTVQGNSGGILLSDDTGTVHDNLVSYNVVNDNPFACGINITSHVPAEVTGSAVPFGAFHNVVFGNRSKHNGFSVGGGAGIGVFASVPGAMAYGNVVIDNFVSENGHPGISMHSHAPGQLLNDNMIVGNTVVDNGADTADAATPGPTGINIYSLLPVTGNMISGNSIQNESYDVAVSVPALVQVQFNGLLGTQIGVDNIGAGAVDATSNWWSCPNGPVLPGSCSASTESGVQYLPVLGTPIPAQPNY